MNSKDTNFMRYQFFSEKTAMFLLRLILTTLAAVFPNRNTRNCRNSALTPRVNSHARYRYASLHPAGYVTRNLHALLHAVAYILHKMLAA